MIYRNTDKRQSILDYLKSVKTHPTAYEIYDNQLKKFPNISASTVYRNLQVLCEQGKVVKIEVGDSVIHYDADLSNHAHFICQKCGKIIDITFPKIEDESLNSYKINKISYQAYGECETCI